MKEKRFALVIGNAAYQHARKLKNPLNDADIVASQLAELGFEVTKKTDLSSSEMTSTLEFFESRLAPNDLSLFYFSGHGIQIDGTNFLIPVDFDGRSEFDSTQLISLDDLFKSENIRNRKRIIFLDACRQDTQIPVARKHTGLAKLDPKGEVFIAFATAPDRVAWDGVAKYSPFAEAFVSHLATNRIDLNEFMRRVRQNVLEITDFGQTPWSRSSLTQEIVLCPVNWIAFLWLSMVGALIGYAMWMLNEHSAGGLWFFTPLYGFLIAHGLRRWGLTSLGMAAFAAVLVTLTMVGCVLLSKSVHDKAWAIVESSAPVIQDPAENVGRLVSMMELIAFGSSFAMLVLASAALASKPIRRPIVFSTALTGVMLIIVILLASILFADGTNSARWFAWFSVIIPSGAIGFGLSTYIPDYATTIGRARIRAARRARIE